MRQELARIITRNIIAFQKMNYFINHYIHLTTPTIITPVTTTPFLDLIDTFFRKFTYDGQSLAAYEYLAKKEFDL
jgi:hypothetical protein